MSERLLGFLVGRLDRPPEPTATVALTYVLERSQAAATALVSRASLTGVVIPQHLNFEAESAAGGEGRPDITGFEGGGAARRARLIIEAKFDARLLDGQVSAYMARFRPDANGVLILLAPEHRLPSLWHEALRQLPDAPGQGTDSPAPTADMTTYTHLTPEGNAMLGLSWSELMSSLSQSAHAVAEPDTASDLEQLDSLASLYESQTFVPFLTQDLDLRSARAYEQTMNLFWDLRRDLQNAGLPPRGNVSYAHQYIASSHPTTRANKPLTILRGTEMWLRTGVSPLWVTVRASSGLSILDLRAALASLGASGGPGLVVGQETVRVPLHLRRNAAKDDVRRDLVRQVVDIALLLDAAIGSESPGDEVEIGSGEASFEGDGASTPLIE